jgi:indole-3-glycerol phosphate synthase
MSFLLEILESTKQAVAERKRQLPLAEMLAALVPRSDDRTLLRALEEAGTSVIAEFKRQSPSYGLLREAPDLREIISAYERGGARALSVLTESSYFDGSIEDLRVARAISKLPILRKDFVVDEYQVYEAAQAGADAILLIVAALDPGELRHLHDLARNLHLDVLVETRSEDELEVALDIKADIVGINNRLLQVPSPVDIEVDIATTYKLIESIPKNEHHAIVSESGIRTRDELDALSAVGVDAALIGTALMKAPDPEAMCRELTSPHRSSRASKRSDQPVLA